MAELSYQDAVQMLRDRVGARWEGYEADGKDEMIKLLKQSLRYSDAEAHNVLDAMMQSGDLRYHRANDVADGDGIAAAPVAVGNTSSGTGIPMPIAPAALVGSGYWQIGREESDAEPGRAGQVKPRGL